MNVYENGMGAILIVSHKSFSSGHKKKVLSALLVKNHFLPFLGR